MNTFLIYTLIIFLFHLIQTATDGDKVDLIAKVSGTEPFDIQWALNKKPIKPSDIYVISYDKGTCKLHFPEVFPEDAGEYSLTVKNPGGMASCMATLIVKGQ